MRQKIYSPCFFLRVLDVPDDEPDKGGREKLGGEVENTEGGAEELKYQYCLIYFFYFNYK